MSKADLPAEVSGSDTSGSSGKSLWIAIACGTTPLVTGTGIFLTWLVTRWQWLMLAGLWTIALGLAAFFIGWAALAYYYLTSQAPHRGRKLLLAGSLLLVNFPAAFAIIVVAGAVDSRYSVHVQNDSPDTLTEVVISGGGCRAELGTLAPGESASASFWIRWDDELTFTAEAAGQPLEAIVDDYVTNGMGGDTRVTVTGSRIVSQTTIGEPLITEREP